MSDIIPFAEGNGAIERSVDESMEVFKPDLQGVDWAAYKQRQEELNAARITGQTMNVIREHSDKPGLLLNNLHDLDLAGELPKGLDLPLTVLTRSKISAPLIGANLHGAVGSGALVRGSLKYSNFTDGVFPRLDLRGVDARGIRFGNAVLTGLTVDKDTNLDGANFSNAYLLDADGFTAEHLGQANFNGAFVFGKPVRSGVPLYDQLAQGFEPGQDPRAVLRQARIMPAGYKIPRISSGVDLRGLYAENLTGDGVQLTERNMVGSKLVDPDIRRSVMSGSFISGLVVLGGTFDDTDMHGLWAPGMMLDDVSMRRVNFTGANLVGAYFREVDLREVTGLEYANTNGIVVENCILPDGFYYENGRLIHDDEKNLSGQRALPEK